MRQRWERLTFLHWPYDPAVVQALLPVGLTADIADGAAWVSLVPFFMRVTTPGPGQGVGVPWASYFCETNVRTYVRDARGRDGIWFFSLDAARLGAVVTARTAYRLPYYWSAMRLVEKSGVTTYTCRRRWPGGRGGAVTSRVAVRPGAPVAAASLGALDHFLTARFRLFSPVSSGPPRTARAWHLPWELRAVELVDLDDRLVTAAGLPAPVGAPLGQYSDGVDVRIGRPER
jgi:uncharacterized protein YqjF (DUF2071 family)